ncbi:hypothetical protein BCR44DRAFT_49605 [Catenaria anguillulae PL171]|uniref:FAD/NAD(P)-binding domain-containing protein n=1 Tax=Catenaria anguillulae PL171 TaxID=765915 RepID=A0A1Y2HQF1_9FUNG|nr:hypothetical protein BCR44DRAFT_49605 [Catenaria anguillulae PL171]
MTISTADDTRFKNVVILGGSCGGIGACHKLRELGGLPAPYRIVLIEQHSHMHYCYAFPRAAVHGGFERELFAPYSNMFGGDEARGIVIQATAKQMTPTHIITDKGESIPYEYVIIATGTTGPEPTTLMSHTTKTAAIDTLKKYQARIAAARDVVVVGGGAAGLEMAAEIKESFPETNVTLVHSRDSYLPAYEPRLAEEAASILDKLGVVRILGKRVDLSGVPTWASSPSVSTEEQTPFEVRATDGSSIVEKCDLIMMCTGMRPNSEALATLTTAPLDKSGYINVLDTMQVADAAFPNIFAIGNVAATDDVKMGYTAWRHGALALTNIIKLIEGKNKDGAAVELEKRERATPQMMLYMGMKDGAAQIVEEKSGQVMVVDGKMMAPYFTHNIGADRVWQWLGSEFKEENLDL